MLPMTKGFKVLMVCMLLGHGGIVLAQEVLVIADDKLVINEIQIQGNTVTHEKVILRELVFAEGDTVYKMDLLPSIQRSKDNLLNLALFNFVIFKVNHLGENRIDMIIDVIERWYIWPVPILEYADRNFSTFIKNKDWDKINYGLWLKWHNFTGRNDLLSGKIRLGYIKEYALAYSFPNLGKKQRHGVSAGFNMNQQNEVYVTTQHNKPVEIRTFRSAGTGQAQCVFQIYLPAQILHHPFPGAAVLQFPGKRFGGNGQSQLSGEWQRPLELFCTCLQFQL